MIKQYLQHRDLTTISLEWYPRFKIKLRSHRFHLDSLGKDLINLIRMTITLLLVFNSQNMQNTFNHNCNWVLPLWYIKTCYMYVGSIIYLWSIKCVKQWLNVFYFVNILNLARGRRSHILQEEGNLTSLEMPIIVTLLNFNVKLQYRLYFSLIH